MRLRRHPERGVISWEWRDAVLADAVLAHVGLVEEGAPLVIPMLFHPEGEHVFLHGSPASRLLRHAASGAPLCITVTVLDGLVAGRSALTHSANDRSVVIVGRGKGVADPEERRRLLERMTTRCFRGRRAGDDDRPATQRPLHHLAEARRAAATAAAGTLLSGSAARPPSPSHRRPAAASRGR